MIKQRKWLHRTDSQYYNKLKSIKQILLKLLTQPSDI